MKIPKHNDEALKTLEEHGIYLYDYADYLDKDKKQIIDYQKWGRGYRKDILERIDQ
jgi:hypothetical protein